MPKDDKRKELTQEEIDAQNEKFRTFFSTSVAQVPEEMKRRDEEKENTGSLLGKLFHREKDKEEPAAALDLGDKVGVDRLVRRAVGVAHMRRHGADDKAVFQLKVADLAGLKYFFQFHSIPPVLHAHAGSGRCAAAWAIAIVGLFLPKNLCDFNNALFCNDEPKSKYIQKSSLLLK